MAFSERSFRRSRPRRAGLPFGTRDDGAHSPEMQKEWEAEGKPRLDIGIGLQYRRCQRWKYGFFFALRLTPRWRFRESCFAP